MSWQVEWTALSRRIVGLLEAGRFYFGSGDPGASDPFGAAKLALIPNSREIFELLRRLLEVHRGSLPHQAAVSLERFIGQSGAHFQNDGHNPAVVVRLQLTELAAFQTEFSYHLGDFEAATRRRAERAFLHLQRSIIADPEIAARWQNAFSNGEIACEKLGAAHLLLHGLWAFKADSIGERTDLIMGERLVDLSQAEAAVEALVLTEWKRVRGSDRPEQLAEQAYRQASRYAAGSLAGFELASCRYLVLVSEKLVELPYDKQADGMQYRYINIAVNPQVPSRS